MERITYRISLDTHKTGIQRTLQGFETGDNMSRRITINLMAGGNSFELPLESVTAMMYVTAPDAEGPSINACTIEDNTIIYDVLPTDIAVEGMVEMQVKLIEGDMDGARKVLLAPKFVLEVTESIADDGSAEKTTTFTALEDALARATAVYDTRLTGIEITDDCVFKVFYADGTVYENDYLHDALYNGNALLSESFAHGNTGTRDGENTDNAMYYSNVAKSVSAEAKQMYALIASARDEVLKHSIHTTFSVNFETGNLTYESVNYDFGINADGELEFTLQTA